MIQECLLYFTAKKERKKSSGPSTPSSWNWGNDFFFYCSILFWEWTVLSNFVYFMTSCQAWLGSLAARKQIGADAKTMFCLAQATTLVNVGAECMRSIVNQALPQLFHVAHLTECGTIIWWWSRATVFHCLLTIIVGCNHADMEQGK